MSELLQLWLPILVTAVAVFAASSLVHMVFKWHNSEYREVSNEETVRQALRDAKLSPGLYMTPRCQDMKGMASEDMQQKYRQGPVALITVFPNAVPNMGRNLGLWFGFNVLIAAGAAAFVLQAIPLTGNGGLAAHLIGILTFIAYGAGSVQDHIWMGKTLSSMLKYLLDALIYAVISAMVFCWLWP